MAATGRAVQDVFRSANERLSERTRRPRMVLLCECSDRDCLADLEVHADEYEELRGRGHFVLKGHADPKIERIVDERETFDLVRKTQVDGEV
jgi:hypothetical protein